MDPGLEAAFTEAMRRVAEAMVDVNDVLGRVVDDARQADALRARLRSSSVQPRRVVWDEPDAHRFNASVAEAEEAIAEWRAFVNDIRSKTIGAG